MIKTQNGNVKKSKTLRLTGIYFIEPKYPKLITEIQIPVTTIVTVTGNLEGTCSLLFYLIVFSCQPKKTIDPSGCL